MNLQGNFNQDSITIFLDNQQIFSKQVTTNNLLGLADVVAPISKESGSHQLKIEMNGISTAENFNLQSALYVGINFNPTTKKFELIYSKEPFLYD